MASIRCPTVNGLASASAGVRQGRALVAYLDDIGNVPTCYRTYNNGDFDWEAALGPKNKFYAAVRATCPPNTAVYYCYGKDNKAYKKCIGMRFPVDECKLEDQCTYPNYTPSGEGN